MRFVALLAAWLAFAVPAQALTPSQRAALSGSPCANIALAVSFGNNAASCYKGVRVGSYAQILGWSSGSGTAANGVIDGDCNGLPVSWPSGTPRIMCNRLSVFAAITNSFLNSEVPVTQNVTTSAVSWNLSFWGTGSIVMSGQCAGTLNGAGANVRVNLTVACAAGTTTLTVSGSVAHVLFWPGIFAGPVPTTLATTATKTADLPLVTGNPLPVGNWTIIARAAGLANNSTGGNVRLFELDDGSTANAIEAHAPNSGPTVAASLTVASSTIFATQISATGVIGAATHVAMTKNGSAVRGSAFGQAPIALGTWSAFTPTTALIGYKSGGTLSLNGYFEYLSIANGGLTDSALQRASQ